MGRTKIRERNVLDADFLSEQEFELAKGAPGGVAPLGPDSKIPCVYLRDDCGGSGDISWLFGPDGKIKYEYLPDEYNNTWGGDFVEWGDDYEPTTYLTEEW